MLAKLQKLDLGDYYLLDTRSNGASGDGVDPVELGRKLGVLQEWEAVEENDS